MKGIVLIVLLLSGCASSPSGPDVSIHLQQLTTYSDLRFGGPVNVDFRVTVYNQTDSDVTLRRIEVRTIGPGPYSLSEPPIPLNLRVAARSTEWGLITARGFAAGGNMTSREQSSVRATAYFDGPNGAFIRTVNESLGRE
jgi:hypothetical protein